MNQIASPIKSDADVDLIASENGLTDPTPTALSQNTPGRTRTPNLLIWNQLLCQLSYWRKIASHLSCRRLVGTPTALAKLPGAESGV